MQRAERRVRFRRVHRRLDDAWRDRVGANAAFGVFDREGAGCRVQAALGERGESASVVLMLTTWPLECFSISAMASCVM